MKRVAFITSLSSEIYILNLIDELRKYSDIKIIGIYGTSKAFFAFYTKGSVDIVFIDYSILDDSPINVAKKIKAIDPRVKIIGIATSPNVDFIKKFLEAGTDGFLLKLDDNSKVIKDLVEEVGKRYYLSPSLEKSMRLYKSVLVVDDFENTRFIVKFVLEQEGFKVLTAENGKKALSVLESEAIDVIITDLNMPEMDGVEFIETLKSHPRYKNIPVLVLTTDLGSQTKQKIKRLKIAGYIQKPFELKSFVSAVKQLLR